jgi:hypothetical protein
MIIMVKLTGAIAGGFYEGKNKVIQPGHDHEERGLESV